MSKVIIFGSNGQLGRACARKWKNAILCSHEDVDICDEEKLTTFLDLHKPQIVINAAAYTNVERAEEETKLALDTNGIAPMFLAKATKNVGAVLVHISTDYVFNGLGHDGFFENSRTNPLNFYGLSKRFGEETIEAYGEKFYILRTSALFGDKTADKDDNFVFKRILQIEQGQDISMVSDQWTVPTCTDDLVECIESMLEKDLPYGIYHAVNSGAPVSWFDLTKQIANNLSIMATISPVNTSSSKTLVRRPRYSVLRDTKLREAGIILPNWEESLAEYVQVACKKVSI